MDHSSFKGSNVYKKLNSDAIVKFITIFPDVNLYWLLLGEGEMSINSIVNFKSKKSVLKLCENDEIKYGNDKDNSPEIIALKDHLKSLKSQIEFLQEKYNELLTIIKNKK